MEDLALTQANLKDTDHAFAVIDACRRMLEQQGMDNWKRYTREKVVHLITSDSLFLLKLGKETLGTVKISETPPSFFTAQDLEKWENPTAKACYFTALAVSPQHQSGGYGSQLLALTENYARQQQAAYLRMTMFAKNESLARYYLRRGFSFPQKRVVETLGLRLAFGEKKLTE